MSYEAALNEEIAEATPVEKSKKGKNKMPEATFPQFNEDGTPVLDADGKQVWGLEKSDYTSKTPKTKRVRKPKYLLNEDGTPVLDEEGNPVPVPKKVREPKVVEYQKDEDGNFILDEEGNQIPVKKTRAPRLDADGNPIPKLNNTFLDSQVIHRTEKGLTAKYREGSDRQNMFDAMQDGVTVGEFYEARGGKAKSHRFLVHQLNVLQTITID